jgi:hypothetical protein
MPDKNHDNKPKIQPRPANRQSSGNRQGSENRPGSGAARRGPARTAERTGAIGLVETLNSAIIEVANSQRTLASRSKLLFDLIVKHFNPSIALLMGEIEKRPMTRMHHDDQTTDLQAIEIRQELLDQIVAQVRGEGASKAYLKRFNGAQIAILAIPCCTPSSDVPFAGLAIGIRESNRDRVRESMHFIEALARIACDVPETTLDTVPDTGDGNGDLLQGIAKATKYETDLALAFQIVNGIATKFHCEQAAIGLVRGKQVKVVAISGAAAIKRNSPGTICMEGAMDECFDQKDQIAFPRLKTRNSTAANGMHQMLSKSTGQASVCSLPILDGETCVAVVTLRRPTGDSFSEEELRRLEEKLLPCGPALKVLGKASRTLVSHARDSLQTMASHWVGDKAKFACLIAAGLLLAWLSFGRTVYRPSCGSELAASNLQHVAAPLDGIIQAVYVHPGQRVRKGEPLVEFDASSMRLEKQMLEADIGEATIDMKTAMSEHDPKAASLQAAKIAAIKAKLDGVRNRIEQATVHAPADCQVVRCDLATKIGQDFKFGMPLMELAAGDAWSIDIQVPDTVAPYVANGQIGEFSPYGRPGDSYPFKIQSVSGRADVKGGKNVFTATAVLTLPSDQPPAWMKVGMSGVAKIETESRPVYWVYFHDAIDWLHKTIWY